MKPSNPGGTGQSLFQKQQAKKRSSISPARQSSIKKEQQQQFRRKEARKTTKTLTKQISTNTPEIPENLQKQRQARTVKLIEYQKHQKEGTNNSRSHSIQDQQPSSKQFFKSKQTLKEATIHELSKQSRPSMSHIDDQLRSKSNFSVIQNESEIHLITRNLPLLNRQQKQQVASDLNAVEQIDERQEESQEASIFSQGIFVVEEEHNKLTINESLQRSASKKAFEKVNKTNTEVEEIEEEENSQNSFDDYDLRDRLINNICKGTNQDEIILEESENEESSNINPSQLSLSVTQKQMQQDEKEKEENIEETHDILMMLDAYKDPYNIQVGINHGFQWAVKEARLYKDERTFLLLRKILFILIVSLQIISYRIAKSTYFDFYEIALTLSNIALFLSDSSGQHNTMVQPYQYVFLTLYFLDICVQLLGKGFKKFVEDLWNIYDVFILVLYGIFILNRELMPLDVSTFRVIRIPFYFGRLNKELNIMLTSLKESFKAIVENLLTLVFFSVLLSIIALNLFQGVLKYRCMHNQTGIFMLSSYESGVCGYIDCPADFTCARQITNIDYPTNFDKMQFAYTQIIRTTLINDWTITMYMLMKQFNPLVCFYYILITFIVDKFCFQLVIAVLKVYYHRTTDYYYEHPLEPEQFEDKIRLNLKVLKNLQLWHQLQKTTELYHSKGDFSQVQDFLGSRSISTGSLRQLMNKQIRHNNNEIDIQQDQQNEAKARLLSARQTNEDDNYKQKMKEQFEGQTWIIKFLMPDHPLQEYMVKQIDKSQEACLLVYDMEIFYRFRSADMLSLYLVPYYEEYESTSEQDVIIRRSESPKWKGINKQVYNIEEIMQNVKVEKIKRKLAFPVQRRRQIDENSIIDSPRQVKNFQNLDYDDEVDELERNNKLLKMNLKKMKTIKRQTFYQQDKKITFDQQLKMAQALEEQETDEKKYSNFIVIDGVIFDYGKLNQIINEDETKNKLMAKQEIKDYQSVYNHIILQDQSKQRIDNHNWSGNDIFPIVKYNLTVQILKLMNQEWRYYLSKGFIHYLHRIQYKLIIFITHPFITIAIDSLVCVNTIILAFFNYFDEDISAYSDITINVVLLVEMIIKGLCSKRYFHYTINILESLLILISTFERSVTMFDITAFTEASSVFLYLRVLKALYFFRVIKYNVFASNMITISYQTFPSYATMALLLFFLLLNYALFGLQIFTGKFPEEDLLTYLHYYGNAYQAWFAVFDISTGDDWYGVVILSNTYSNQEIAFLYCISLIFIINYLTFGLLLAIILDGFNQYINNMETLHQNKEDQEFLLSEEMESDILSISSPTSQVIKNKKKMDFTMDDVLENLIKPENYEKYINEVQCRISLFIFHKKNKFRKMSYLICENYKFKVAMQIVAWGSLINMIAMTFYDFESNENTIFDVFQIIFNLAILLDGCMRIISFGALGEQGYFHSLWVSLDFIYVFFYFIHLFYLHDLIEGLLFIGYLRPLKVTSYSGFFQNERGAILQSIGDILSILYVIFLFWFIFGIFGMTIYKDQMGYCDHYTNFGISRDNCTGKWINYPHNFDTIINSMQTLFILSTFDGWGVIFFVCINSNKAEFGPIRFNTEWPSYLFFLLFQFIGSLFFLGFFAGILFINFKQKKSQLLNPDLTLNQELFLKISDTIMKEISTYSDPPKRGIRLLAKQLLTSKYYLYTSKFAQFLNLLLLMMYQEEGSDEYLHTINLLNHFFSLILFIDLCVKMLTYHIQRYFGESWRRMEFIFVIISIIDFSLDMKYDWVFKYARINRNDPLFIWLRLFYVFRDLRMILIIQLFTGIRRLLNVIAFNIMTILRIVGLFITVLTCYSYIGCRLFGQIDKGDIMHDQLNYKNFFYGLLTLFKVQTKNGWRNIMTDSTSLNPYCQTDPKQCGQPWALAILFYFSCVMVCSHVLMNLIVCELVDEFERFYDTNSNVIETYVEQIDKFRNVWCNKTQEYKGVKMHTKNLAYFLLELGEPFGAQRGDNVWDAAKHASSFQLKSDKNGCIYFRGLLYECVKQSFRDSIYGITTPAGTKIMKKNDKKIRYRLYNLRDHQMRRNQATHVIDLEPNFNILQEYLYLFMALKTWKSFAAQFFKVAGDSDENTVVYSENDIIEEIEKNEAFDQQQLSFEENSLQHYPSRENLRRPTDVYILQYYQQQPKHRMKISYLDRIFQKKMKDNIIFNPISQDQKQVQRMKELTTLKKKEQLIKADDIRKHQDIDKPQTSRNRYAYGYHDKMVINFFGKEELERMQSRMDITRAASTIDVTKQRKSVKFK